MTVTVASFRKTLDEVPPHKNFGKVRRNTIKRFFDEFPEFELPINKCWQIHTNREPELRKLIKNGFLKQIRIGRAGGMGQSYLIRS